MHGSEYMCSSNAFYGCGECGRMIRECPYVKNHDKEDTQPRPNPSTVVEPPK